MRWPTTAADLISVAVALKARRVAGWSRQEEELVRGAPPADPETVEAIRDAILSGEDPLGTAFCRILSPEQRRPQGATYTPKPVIAAMMEWAQAKGDPERIVDPGAGSGRFAVAGARQWPKAEIIAVEIDPLAALLARANLATLGCAARARVVVSDYRELNLAPTAGRTLFIGNPPYVRHHRLARRWKNWLVERASAHGLRASRLAGLHVHFFLATALWGRRGDFGCFVTAAEWLDVNYGRLVRDLLMGELGLLALSVVEPTVAAFEDAATTAAISCFEIGARPPSVRLRRPASLHELHPLDGGRPVRRERLETAARWSPLLHARRRPPAGYVELGELCRVHRGQVTGANHVWIADEDDADLPGDLLFPAVTKAKELFAMGPVLADATGLRRVIDLPEDLDALDPAARRAVDRFLARLRRMGIHRGYVARARRVWWSIRLRPPAPILATYMARRPPTFVRNRAEVRHINIAHGIYPREPLTESALLALVDYLRKSVPTTAGRTYAGGLTKFEPREMERILVPEPGILATWRCAATSCSDRG